MFCTCRKNREFKRGMNEKFGTGTPAEQNRIPLVLKIIPTFPMGPFDGESPLNNDSVVREPSETAWRDETMVKHLMRLWKDEEAPTAVEYALMVAGIAGVIIVAVYALGGKVSSRFDVISKTI
jgi:pilus assembly protein Flp/PilA